MGAFALPTAALADIGTQIHNHHVGPKQ